MNENHTETYIVSLLNRIDARTSERDEAVRERDGYKAALEFYADEENWHQTNASQWTDNGYEYDARMPAVFSDEGDVAREALSLTTDKAAQG